jgi:hypothetical protein
MGGGVSSGPRVGRRQLERGRLDRRWLGGRPTLAGGSVDDGPLVDRPLVDRTVVDGQVVDRALVQRHLVGASVR